MRSRQFIAIAIAAVLAVAMAGCADMDIGQPADPEVQLAEQAVTVVPEFQVDGATQMPGELYLSQLGLVITEIRLEPITNATDGVAYSTRRPTVLNFDVARGESVKVGEPLTLPDAGRYLVSVRLEPSREEQTSLDSSFSVAGFVASEGIQRVDPRYDEDGKRADGSPVPMPYDEDESGDDDELGDAPALPTQWTPFHYESKRAVFFTLGEVEFEQGKQFLSFRFDVEDWALELVDPILSAVERNDAPQVDAQEGVDVTNPLESTGHGAEVFFENASVSSSMGR